MKTTVLITGGAGFIGSHLCDYFISHGCRVICVDNLMTAPKRNIQHLLSTEDFQFVQQDISTPLEISEKLDFVLHFASPASPTIMQNNPVETAKVASMGTLHALELAKTNEARFILASSDAVYGNSLVHPQIESYFGNVNPTGLRSSYDEGKRFAEALTMAYHRQCGVNTSIIRIFHSYGERMCNDGRLIAALLARALADKPIEIWGDGSQSRSFCYISDLIDGIVRICDAAFYDPINLGNPEEITILDLARLIIRLTGSASSIEMRDALPEDRKSRMPDIRLAQKVIGWQPVVNLEAGLKKTIDFAGNLAHQQTLGGNNSE